MRLHSKLLVTVALDALRTKVLALALRLLALLTSLPAAVSIPVVTSLNA